MRARPALTDPPVAVVPLGMDLVSLRAMPRALTPPTALAKVSPAATQVAAPVLVKLGSMVRPAAPAQLATWEPRATPVTLATAQPTLIATPPATALRIAMATEPHLVTRDPARVFVIKHSRVPPVDPQPPSSMCPTYV